MAMLRSLVAAAGLLAVSACQDPDPTKLYVPSAKHVGAIPPNIANISLLTGYVASYGAMALDGTPAAIYVRVEPGGEPNKFYIHQQGG